MDTAEGGMETRTPGIIPLVKTRLEIVTIVAEIMQMVTIHGMNPLLTMMRRAPLFS